MSIFKLYCLIFMGAISSYYTFWNFYQGANKLAGRGAQELTSAALEV